jgi:hypothetical protein
MWHNSSRPTNSTSLKLRLLTLSFGLAIAGSLLLPILVRAGVMDELSGTLSQTVSSATNAALNPIKDIENKIGSTIDQVEGGISDALGKSPLGNLLGGALHSVFAPIEQQISNYLLAFQNFFQRSIGSLLGGLLGGNNPANGGDVIVPTETVGALGIPDFEATHNELEQQAISSSTQGFANSQLQASDRFNLNPITLSRSQAFEYDRTQSRGMSASVLSKEGQQAMAQQVKSTAQALADIQSKDQKAQGMDVTQDVMKNLTTIAHDQSQIEAGNFVQLTALRMQSATNGLVEANISEAVDEANRTHHAESTAGAYSVMSGAANLYLPGTNRKSGP